MVIDAKRAKLLFGCTCPPCSGNSPYLPPSPTGIVSVDMMQAKMRPFHEEYRQDIEWAYQPEMKPTEPPTLLSRGQTEISRLWNSHLKAAQIADVTERRVNELKNSII